MSGCAFRNGSLGSGYAFRKGSGCAFSQGLAVDWVRLSQGLAGVWVRLSQGSGCAFSQGLAVVKVWVCSVAWSARKRERVPGDRLFYTLSTSVCLDLIAEPRLGQGGASLSIAARPADDVSGHVGRRGHTAPRRGGDWAPEATIPLPHPSPRHHSGVSPSHGSLAQSSSLRRR